MVKLTSTSKPAASTETTTPEAAAQRYVQPGKSGTASADASRAANAYVRVGKSDAPIVPRLNQGGGVLETVIGPDDRERILETDLAPWRMVCALRLVGSGGGSAIGTGWLAGTRTVVTAGHCVHDQRFFDGWADHIEVSPGRDDQDFPFGTSVATRFSALNEWVANADPDFDIGCIHLEEPLGDNVGFFGFAALPADDLEHHLVNVSGYPGDRGNGRLQYFHANRVLHVSDRRVFYDIDTFGGQSGSGVWIKETEQSEPIVVAIHAYGTGGTPFNLGITANSAPRIIPEVFEIIQGWVEQDNAGS